MDNTLRSRLIAVASGEEEADLLITGAFVLNVFSNEWMQGNVAICGGSVAGIGDYSAAREVMDAAGCFLVPGFINAHCHVESSMVSPEIYCREELRQGVTTLVTDPHEVANVAGIAGIRFMLDTVRDFPMNYYVMLPSCVPATGFEHAGAVLTAEDLKPLLCEPEVLGLGELMNFPGVLRREPDVMQKIDLAAGQLIDGHAPGVSSRALHAYAASGIATDHESHSYAEAMDKLRAGLAVLVREGSACKNLEDILKGVAAAKGKTEFLAFCSDDKHLADIRREGSIRHCVQKAIALGIPPAQAYCMASLNAARIYRLRRIGAIAPGYRADMVLLRDRDKVEIVRVFKDGQDAESLLKTQKARDGRKRPENSVRLPLLQAASFALPEAAGACYPVIGLVGGQIITEKTLIAASEVAAAIEAGILCKVSVVERHRATGHIGTGLLKGYGLRQGAVASTVGHDSHNLIVVGVNDADMLAAAEEIQRMGGGFAYVRDGKPAASLPLPLFGLMSEKTPEELIPAMEHMLRVLHEAGVARDIDPLVTLSFLALPVIPEIRITDMGVYDVTEGHFVGTADKV